jgi:hypothetical protein
MTNTADFREIFSNNNRRIIHRFCAEYPQLDKLASCSGETFFVQRNEN